MSLWCGQSALAQEDPGEEGLGASPVGADSFVEQAFFDDGGLTRGGFSDQRGGGRYEVTGPGGALSGPPGSGGAGGAGPPMKVFGWKSLRGDEAVFTTYDVGIGTESPRTAVDLRGDLHVGPGAPVEPANVSVAGRSAVGVHLETTGASTGEGSRLVLENRETGQGLMLGVQRTSAAASRGALRQRMSGEWYDHFRIRPDRTLRVQSGKSSGAGAFGGVEFGTAVEFLEGIDVDSLQGLERIVPAEVLSVGGPVRMEAGPESPFAVSLRESGDQEAGAQVQIESEDGTPIWRYGTGSEGEAFRVRDPARADTAQGILSLRPDGTVQMAPAGNVGIGTGAPETKLSVAGPVRAEAREEEGYGLAIRGSDEAGAALRYEDAEGAVQWRSEVEEGRYRFGTPARLDTASAALAVEPGGAMQFDPVGGVEFGTAVEFLEGIDVDSLQDLERIVPAEVLSVAGPVRMEGGEEAPFAVSLQETEGQGAQTQIESANGTPLWRYGTGAEGEAFRVRNPSRPDTAQGLLSLRQDGSVQMAPAGNVGIGTGAPETKLSVAGPVRAEVREEEGYGLAIRGSDEAGAALRYEDAEGAVQWRSEVDGGLYRLGTPARLDTASAALSVESGGAMRLDPEGNVGIGLSDPSATLGVGGPARVRSTGDTPYGLALRPTAGGKAQVQVEATDGTALWRYGIPGEGNNAFRVESPSLPDSSARPLSIQRDGTVLLAPGTNVGIGQPDPDAKLAVNGTIRTKQVEVTAEQWADDVFEEGYDLRSLEELAAFIEKEGHLPRMPTTEEAKEGINLGRMDARLLRQVEELVRYTLDQEHRLSNQREQLQTQENRLEAQSQQLKTQQAQIERQADQIQKQRQQIREQRQQIERLTQALKEKVEK